MASEEIQRAKERAKARAENRKVSELWEARVLRDKQGAPKKLIANVILILTHDEAWTGCLAWDEFADRVVITARCPAGEPGPWTDLCDVETAAWLQTSRWRLEAGHDLVANAIRAVADRKRIHPVRDWLQSLTWDGCARIDTWLGRYLGVEDSVYSRAVGRRWLVAAVARIMRPGCQVDTMLILEGDQGVRKSTALRVLAGDEWFLDTGVDVRDAGAAHALRRRWIVEFSELAALKGSDVERVKQFVSTRVDSYRPPYGRHVLDHPRQCVLVGSTNARQYLRDETGARRFWPVRVREVDIHALAADREQLWVEALEAWKCGEKWYLDTSELADAARQEQDERRSEDPWEQKIRSWLEHPMRQVSGVRTGDILGELLGVEPGRWTRGDEMRVGAILRQIGWSRRKVRNASSLSWMYFPTPEVGGRAYERNTESLVLTQSNPTVPTVPTNIHTSYIHRDTPQPASDLPDQVGQGGNREHSTDSSSLPDWWEVDS